MTFCQRTSCISHPIGCGEGFPARPADPDSSVFAELFPAPQPEPSQPDVPTAKAKQMHLN